MSDDAAIRFRYVQRAVARHGLSYKDHERVLRTSDLLYAFGLTTFVALGFDVESTARRLGVARFATAAVLAAALSQRFLASALGLLAGVLLLTTHVFQYQAFSGMESIVAACLGLLVALALLNGRAALAGVFLGIAIWIKLDARLLALAITAA